MSLKGTLADLRIVDLIQFPHAGRKSGLLVIKNEEQEAKLYYEKGSLVHVTLDDAQGMDALVLVVDWNKGSFEFVNDVQADRKSIELDLHRAVMQALKIHDELKAEEARRKGVTEAAVTADEGITAKLRDFVSANDFALHASALAADGTRVASVDGRSGAPAGVDELLGALSQLRQSYSRATLSRVIVEDDLGTVVMVSLGSGGSVVVVADQGANLGAVAMSVARLAARLE